MVHAQGAVPMLSATRQIRCRVRSPLAHQGSEQVLHAVGRQGDPASPYDHTLNRCRITSKLTSNVRHQRALSPSPPNNRQLFIRKPRHSSKYSHAAPPVNALICCIHQLRSPQKKEIRVEVDWLPDAPGECRPQRPQLFLSVLVFTRPFRCSRFPAVPVFSRP
jgi:hypothetical protein